MAIDVSKFHLHNVIDSCSIWNLLSSQLLYASSTGVGCTFACCEYVVHECLGKARKVVRSEDVTIQEAFRAELNRGKFTRIPITIEDLLDVEVLESRKRVGRGELASIVLARKLNLAFLTDDQPARKVAAESLGDSRVQTIPHLLGWLFFIGRLSDADKDDVFAQHRRLRPKDSLEKYFEITYRQAMQYRLVIMKANQSDSHGGNAPDE